MEIDFFVCRYAKPREFPWSLANFIHKDGLLLKSHVYRTGSRWLFGFQQKSVQPVKQWESEAADANARGHVCGRHLLAIL